MMSPIAIFLAVDFNLMGGSLSTCVYALVSVIIVICLLVIAKDSSTNAVYGRIFRSINDIFIYWN